MLNEGKWESWWDRTEELKQGKRRKEMALTDQFPICYKWFRQFWCDIQQFLKPTDNNVVLLPKPINAQNEGTPKNRRKIPDSL